MFTLFFLVLFFVGVVKLIDIIRTLYNVTHDNSIKEVGFKSRHR